MRVLVIGGTRFLGYHLVQTLLDHGHEVTLFNRGLTPDDFGHRVKRIRGDRTNFEEMKTNLRHREFDVVVDMIAYKGKESEQAVELFSGKVGHYIHISTGAVYLVTKNYPCPLKEEDFDRELMEKPLRQENLWLYGLGKRECEEVLKKAFEEKKFPATIFRLPIVIGERDYTLRAYSYFLRLKDGGPIILPDGGLNVSTYVYQGDVIQTMARHLLDPRTFGQAYNLAMEEIISLRHFVQESARIIGQKPEIIDVPSFLIESLPCQLSISPFSGRRPFVLSIEKAKRDLNYRSTPFSFWLEKTIHWFLKDYKGPPPENYRWRSLEMAVAHYFRQKLEEIKKDLAKMEVANG